MAKGENRAYLRRLAAVREDGVGLKGEAVQGRSRSSRNERVIDAFFRCEEFQSGTGVDVETREMPPTTDPRSGQPVWVPPVVILWDHERPLAVRVRSVIALNSYTSEPDLTNVIEGCADAYGLPIERITEAGLWRLFQTPPQLRAASY